MYCSCDDSVDSICTHLLPNRLQTSWNSQYIYITDPLQFFCRDGEFSVAGTLVFSTPEDSTKNLFHISKGSYTYTSLIAFFPVQFLLATWTYGLYVPSGGVVRMTLSLTVILMEATGNISYGMPMMLVLTTAKFVGDIFNEGIYDMHIKLQGVPILGWDPPVMVTEVFAKDIISTPVICFQTKEKVGRIVDVLKDTSSHHNGFPVVEYSTGSIDTNEGPSTFGIFKGFILRSQLIILLKHKVFSEEDRPAARHRLKLKHFRDAYPRFLPIRVQPELRRPWCC